MILDLTEGVRETIKSVARKLSGFVRRQFLAEMTLKYCRGNSRQAERTFGWGREAVQTGLNETRTGIRCLDDFSARGRHKSERRDPTLVRQIQAIVEPECPADPKFQTPLAYTRITEKAVCAELANRASTLQQPVPAERTMHDVLNRLGYRLRRVCKTKPQKKPKRTRFSTT